MEFHREARTIKSEIKLVQGFIYVMAICLIVLSVWKYVILQKEYSILFMNSVSALIFILLIEYARKTKSNVFGVGTFMSIGILMLYFWVFGEKFNPFTLDTLLFLLMDTALKFGDDLQNKLRETTKKIDESIKAE